MDCICVAFVIFVLILLTEYVCGCVYFVAERTGIDLWSCVAMWLSRLVCLCSCVYWSCVLTLTVCYFVILLVACGTLLRIVFYLYHDIIFVLFSFICEFVYSLYVYHADVLELWLTCCPTNDRCSTACRPRCRHVMWRKFRQLSRLRLASVGIQGLSLTLRHRLVWEWCLWWACFTVFYICLLVYLLFVPYCGANATRKQYDRR